jgi:hypothetical protein
MPARKPGSQASPPVTPATEVFAEPDGEGEPAAARAQRPSSIISARTNAVQPGRSLPRRVLIVLLVLVLAAAGTIVVALYLTRYRDLAPTFEEPAPPSHKTTGTVKFVIVPSDSAVTVEGKPIHVGSPWEIELDPGVHQIEVQHEGYKRWLTSIDLVGGERQMQRVVLDPLDASATAEATLIVASAPPALEAVLDGTPLTTQTPIKVPIKVGPHTIVLRMNGVDVWTQLLDARANAVYEFNPTIAGLPDRAGAAPPPDHDPATPAPGEDEPPVAPDKAPEELPPGGAQAPSTLGQVAPTPGRPQRTQRTQRTQ